MKFLIVEPSPLTIRIPLRTKYSPQDPVFKYSCSTSVNYALEARVKFMLTSGLSCQVAVIN